MLFSVYPQTGGYPGGYAPPPPPPKKSSWPVILGVCGGCALIALVGMAILFGVGYKFGKPVFQKTLNATLFLKDIQNHRYTEAEKYLSPKAQTTYSAETLKQEFGSLEESKGALKSFSGGRTNVNNQSDTTSPLQLPFVMQYERGSALITFTFTGITGPQSTDPLIQEIDLENVGGTGIKGKNGADNSDGKSGGNSGE